MSEAAVASDHGGHGHHDLGPGRGSGFGTGHGKSEPDEFGKATGGKIAMWIFLLSDAMSFGGLLLGYAIIRSRQPGWPDPTKYLGINFTAVMTFLLICSSVSMVLALAAAHEHNRKQTLMWLGFTILGGLAFLGGQVYEYTHLYHDGVTLSGTALAARDGIPPAFASTFFVITGFHGMHVTAGVIYLITIFIRTAMGKYDHNANPIELCGLFWHFVDLVWILVFTFVYLIP